MYNLPINRTFFIENIDVCFKIDIYTRMPKKSAYRLLQVSSTSTRYINQNTPDTISPPSQHHFFPSSTSYGGQTTASSTTSSRRLGSSIFEPDPSPASPPHRRQKSSDYLHTAQAIPVPAPRAVSIRDFNQITQSLLLATISDE